MGPEATGAPRVRRRLRRGDVWIGLWLAQQPGANHEADAESERGHHGV